MSAQTSQRAPLHLPFVLVAGFGGLALVLVAVMYMVGVPDAAVSQFTGFFLTLFVGLTGFAASVYQLGKRDQVIEEIRSNVNGNLSKAQREKAALEAQVISAGLLPVTHQKAGE